MAKVRKMDRAPKDGTTILLLIDGSWIQGHYDPMLDHAGEQYDDPKWRVVSLPSHGCGCCSSSDPAPTGWLPLPTPPETTA